MAIKNTNLGGTNWTSTDYMASADINDTFNEAYERIISSPSFWMSSTLYDVYDNFDSYATSTIATNTNWTITVANGGVASVVVSNNANGGSTGKELKLEAAAATTTPTALALSKLLTANRHTHVKLAITMAGDTAVEPISVTVSYNSGTTNYNVMTGQQRQGTLTVYTDFTAIAKGSNVYDLYIGGRLVASGVTIATPQFRIYISTGDPAASASATVFVDDVVQSKVSI